MTIRTLGLVAAFGAGAVASPALAVDLPRFDLGAGYPRLPAEGVDLHAVALGGTFHLNDNIGAEAEGQFGVSEESVGPVEVKLDRSLAVFARGDIQLLDTFGLFGRIGYVDMEVEGSLFGASGSDSEAGWAA